MSTANSLLQQLTAYESAIPASVAGQSILVPTAYDKPPISPEIIRDLFRLPKALIFGTTEDQARINQYFGTKRCYDWAAVEAKYLYLVNFAVEEVTVKG